MNINWVLSDSLILDPTISIDQLKNIGSFWGGWRTWRAYATDNVICHNSLKATELLERQFQKMCNLYIPNSLYVTLNRPGGVKLYEGDFMHEVDRQDELAAVHLSATVSDIVLLLGFDLSETEKNPDKLLEHRALNYRNIFRSAIKENPTVQWLLIDHPGKITPELANLENLSTDTLANVIGMLST